MRASPSIAPTSRRIARQWAEKGGQGAGDRPPSRGGRTAKLHLINDLLGRPIVLHLTPGNIADTAAASTLLAAAGRFRRLHRPPRL